MTEPWYPHVTVAAIAERDGRYLIVEETINGAQVFNQPAGHVEKGETLIEAVIRETREETGWGFEPIHLCGIYQYIAPNGETYFRFTFYGELTDHDPMVVLDYPIENVVWMNRTELEHKKLHLRSQSVLACVKDHELGKSCRFTGYNNSKNRWPIPDFAKHQYQSRRRSKPY